MIHFFGVLFTTIWAIIDKILSMPISFNWYDPLLLPEWTRLTFGKLLVIVIAVGIGTKYSMGGKGD